MNGAIDENSSKKDDDEVKVSLLDKNKIKIQPATATCKKKKSSKKVQKNSSGITGLFKYATTLDKCLMVLGISFSIIQGTGMPFLGLVFGSMTNIFFNVSTNGLCNSTVTTTETECVDSEYFMHQMGVFALYYLAIGTIVFFASFLQNYFWELSCERQVHTLRRKFFSQVLRQDITWYDTNAEGDLSTKLSDDLERVREGIGHKFSMVIQYVSTFFSGLGVGLYVNWRLTGVMICVSPILIGSSAVFAKIASSSASREQLKYSLASGVAEQALGCFRTVVAFGGEKKETEKYRIALDKGLNLALKRYRVISIGVFIVFFTMYSSYGLAFWYGSNLIEQGISTPGSVFTVFFSVMSGAFSIGNALPFVNAVATAMGSAAVVFEIIDRKPKIDPYSTQGIKPKKLEGSIEFKNVKFTYPTRSEVPVLKQMSLKVEKGEKIAFVGPSGAGKSTIVNLILRFYDATEGEVLIDGLNVKEINLKWLRQNIGVVSQEPILFGVSIAENIKYGKEDASMDEVVEAAKLANAHTFISDLSQGYDTSVGDRGAQLSGGQKQRIAIARALVRNPKILLLDEATSALDSQSEGIVQEALENAMQGRTTVVIAHRLSTVKNSDRIYVMNEGAVAESGNHDQLMEKKGLYYQLVMAQLREVKDSDLDQEGEKTAPLLTNLSTTSLHKIAAKEENIKDKSTFATVGRLFKLNKPEWLWLLLGILTCAIFGTITPLFAFFYGQFFSTFQLKGDELKKSRILWSLMFVGLGVLAGSVFFAQIVAMTTAAERMLARLRLLFFANVLRQELAWFDQEEHSVGRIITQLSRDAPLVRSASGLRFGQLISAIVQLVCALVIAFIFGWKLALLLSVAIPIIMYAGYKQMALIRNTHRKDMESMDSAGRVASECISNLRTVQALGREEMFVQNYIEFLDQPFQDSKTQAIYFSLTCAISQAVLFLLYAGAFYLGGYLITLGDMQADQIYRVFFALSFCALSIGTSTAYLKDANKGKFAAQAIFNIMDKKSMVDPLSTSGLKPVIKGKILFKNIHFTYPSRTVPILKGLSVSVDPGQTLALVGGSGCGKSTLISLLQRFYIPDSGKIIVDNCEIESINIAYLRSQMGLVTQEPVLFNCTIKENIAYGNDEATDAEIIEAAKTANAHNFISNLPQGYDTSCGDRGTQLSGGQKQRIAIARALVRQPKILLLDEATSALDTESEKIVQIALDKAREGRTSIVIAHRLSTVQNADKIAVIHKGKVAELGTHEELKKLNGIYYELTKRQEL